MNLSYTLSLYFPYFTDNIGNGPVIDTHKNKLSELQKIIGEKIVSLKEEVEIGTNVKLNPQYIADRQDEIECL
jgi:hypothetical protein